jgi:hypothetical protein
MIVIAAVTAVLALAVGRYLGRRGLILASLLVFMGTCVILFGRYEGGAYVFNVILNVAIFEILAVAMMLFRPAVK